MVISYTGPSARAGRRRASRLITALLGIVTATSTGTVAAQTSKDYVTTPNQYVAVDNVRLAYRSIGKGNGNPPLVLFQHFTGTMDDWDSSLIDDLARHRRVIILGNPGIGASQGPAPDSVQGMAHFAEGFIDALKVKKVDVLGYSIGGSVAQLVVADRPELVRKLILVGAGPQGGAGIKDLQTVIATGFKRGDELHLSPKLPLFFTETPRGLKDGKAFLSRIDNHKVDLEPQASKAAIDAQAKALITWGMSPSNFAQLEAIQQPVLIVNGSHDLIIPTVNSWVLYQHIPDAQLILYPDSGHGSLFQYHERFVSEVDTFLDGSH